jgi:hypothetical protein
MKGCSTPCFIKLNGCINCDTYKRSKLPKYGIIEHGEGIAPHEAMVACMLLGDMHHSVLNPYIGNKELKTFIDSKKFPDSGKPATDEQVNNARALLEKRGYNSKFYTEK